MKRILAALIVLSMFAIPAPAEAFHGCCLGKLVHGIACVAGVHRRQERRAARRSAAGYGGCAGEACAVQAK